MTELEARAVRAVQKEFPTRAIDSVVEMGGLMHNNYVFRFDTGGNIVFRAPKVPLPSGRTEDVCFGGPISIEREVAVMQLLHDKTDVPAPKVYALGSDEFGSYALLSHVGGICFADYLAQRGHTIPVFLDALQKIGGTLASTRRVTFDAFGSIQPNGIVHGEVGFANYFDRVIQRHYDNPRVRSHFSQEEWADLMWHISNVVGRLFTERFRKPQLVLYDQHARNFNVHADGPHIGGLSGVFDVEFAQAAPAALEWGCFGIQIFPLYGKKWVDAAKKAFLKGYAEGGGDTTDYPGLEQCCLINYVLSSVALYDDIRDGVRDTWSEMYKRWALNIARGEYDPAFLAELTRPLTKIPKIERRDSYDV